MLLICFSRSLVARFYVVCLLSLSRLTQPSEAIVSIFSALCESPNISNLDCDPILSLHKHGFIGPRKSQLRSLSLQILLLSYPNLICSRVLREVNFQRKKLLRHLSFQDANFQKLYRHLVCLLRATYSTTTILLCFGSSLAYRALQYLIEQLYFSNYFRH